VFTAANGVAYPLALSAWRDRSSTVRRLFWPRLFQMIEREKNIGRNAVHRELLAVCLLLETFRRQEEPGVSPAGLFPLVPLGAAVSPAGKAKAGR
jgi:hypothetical protein